MHKANSKDSATALRIQLFGLPGASDGGSNSNSNNRGGVLEVVTGRWPAQRRRQWGPEVEGAGT